MTEQERQAAIRKASSDLVYASYTWAVRLKYLRETSMWFWQWLSGTDPSADKLTELTTVYRAWLYAEGIRGEQQRLIADTNLTVADANWPLRSTYDSAQLPSIWTDGLAIGRVSGFSAAVDARIETTLGSSLSNLEALQAAVAAMANNGSLITALQSAGLKSAAVNGEGHLILTKNDDTTVDAGSVLGATGSNGLGISMVAIDPVTGHLHVTYTDDSVQDAGSSIGPQGIQGATGETGPQGAQGAQGIKGDTGNTGAIGSQGMQGNAGSTGPAGPTGATGSTGSTGSAGAKGDTGTAGSAGAKGDTGATGAQGTTGAAGSTGAQGSTGATGQSGVIAVNAPLTNAGTNTSANLSVSAATQSTPGTQSAADKTKLDSLTIIGGYPVFSITPVSTTYTALLTDELVLADTTSAAFTVTLPTAVGIGGKEFIIKCIGAKTLTVGTTSSQTIDGALTYKITANNGSITVVSDGANWRQI